MPWWGGTGQHDPETSSGCEPLKVSFDQVWQRASQLMSTIRVTDANEIEAIRYFVADSQFT